MSLADGLAAIVGYHRGQRFSYRIFGATKSRLGTATFLIISLVILTAYNLHQQAGLGILVVLVAAGATVLENIAVRGLDNVVVPVAVAVALMLLTV
jgi:dolichol kinase